MTRLRHMRTAFLEKNVTAMKDLHTTEAIEAHFASNHQVSHFILPEIILGGQDGLVNTMGVMLGVAAATSSSQLVQIAALAAIFAQFVSMTAVAYTSKIAEADYYESEYEREKWEVEHAPDAEKHEIRELYKAYGFEGHVLDQIVEKICANQKVWLDIMMSQELRLEPVDRKRALIGSFVVGMSSLIGGFIPLLPFFVLPVTSAMAVSLLISASTLFGAGVYKAKHTLGRDLLRQGVEMMVIGMMSAFVGYVIGSIFHIK